jgi:hypothetical protein
MHCWLLAAAGCWLLLLDGLVARVSWVSSGEW